MKELLGRPGSVSGLLLRVSQFSCAGIAIAVMVTTDGFAEFTCFCYLVASMALQVLWSLGLACLDIYALSKKRDLQNKLLVRLFVVGDWLTATLSLAAASSSSGIAILFVRDFHFCTVRWGLPCGSYKLAVSFTFVTWILTSRDVLKQFYRFNMISCLPALRDLVPLYKGLRIRRDGGLAE